MGKLLVTVDHQFIRTPDGKVWVKTIYGYDFWKRYLKVFDEVRIACRISDVSSLNEDMMISSGPNVEFFQLPHYRGPKEFVLRYWKIRKAMVGIADGCSCALYRIPSPIANAVHNEVKKKHLPWAVEVVNDPWDTFAPGAYKGLSRPFVRIYFYWQVKFMAGNADGVSYVTRSALQKRYPSYVKRHKENHMHFESFYSSIILNKDFFYYDRAVPHNQYTIVHINSCITDYSKGHDVVIRVLNILRKNGMNVYVKFIGDGPMRSEFEKMALSYEVADYIEFTGLLSGSQAIRQELLGSDLLVFPTKGEGLPRTVIEAMAVGLPCLSTPVNGIPELLPAECLFSQQDDEAFAKKAWDILTNPSLYQKLSRQNLDKAASYEYDALAARRDMFYKRLQYLGEKQYG